MKSKREKKDKIFLNNFQDIPKKNSNKNSNDKVKFSCLKNKDNINSKINNIKDEEKAKLENNKINSSTPCLKFQIKKDIKLVYDPTVNYYQEYWKMFYDNEYLLAQIKENAYEINSMKAHIEEISKN
jgi:hypothetical protein